MPVVPVPTQPFGVPTPMPLTQGTAKGIRVAVPTMGLAPGQSFRTKCQTELEPGGSVENNGTSYRLLSRLGSGCFAEVFKAQHNKGFVAVKILPEETESAARFHQKEAQRLQKLKHPNIVSAYDSFRFVGQRGIYTCIVMEFCGGGTLQGQIRSREIFFSPEVINRYLYQIADGLEYLHGNEIIHGDFKSDNIILTKRGQPKISDFGHSRRVNRSGDGQMAPPMSGGDLMFAPPEYNKDVNVSTTFDMWGLGCILCEMATMSTMGTRSPGMPFVKNPAAFAAMTQDMMTVHGGLYFPLVRGLFVTDPAFRMSAAQVKQAAADMGGRVGPMENTDGDNGAIRWFLDRLNV
eukprot:TRINITY_DN326_c0_g1_i6.p1 TRINITY_DN326_c0_g1~~TRINITY_DN326_c0_g1_i6.p1  ORF type:complete len:349 (-),score=97.96 TRINITY_DN326_c0_g1_i6:324-1370(-)